MQRWLWSFVVAGSLASLGLFWLTGVPLGVPGEWTWPRHDATLDLAANLFLGIIAGVIYLAFVGVGAWRLARPRCRRIESLGWQLGLALVAAAWIFIPLGFGSSGATAGRWPFVLYYSSSSGYFFKARFESPDAKEFLRGYEALMKEGDVLHTGTHPPGLFLFFHGLIGIAKHHQDWFPAINDTQPPAVREAFDVIDLERRQAIVNGDLRARPLISGERAVLWVAGLICLGLGAATVWPLYGFMRLDFDRPASWLIASVWPLVPAIGVFLPKSDVAFAFFAMLSAYLWRSAWRKSSLMLAVLAAGVWTVGVLCSLAFLPVALWLALVSLFDSWPAIRRGEARQELIRGLRTILPATLVVIAMLGLLSQWGDIAIWNVYWWNYHNHAGFYRHYPRTYLSWLGVNPLELLGAAGAPLLVAACFGIGSELRRSFCSGSHETSETDGQIPEVSRLPSGATGEGFDSPVLSMMHQTRENPLAAQSCRQWHPGVPSPLLGPCLATLIVWTWLWLSGKNSGEAARLWTFLLPFVVICAAAWWLPAKDRSPRGYFGWLILQTAVCLLTVQRINGFPL